MSERDDDGGAAFPLHKKDSCYDTGNTGMSLRDYFAAAALPWVLGRDYMNDWGKDGVGHFPSASKAAYKIADAMLKARKEG